MDTKNLKGNILIAEPFSQDGFFHRSVVLLCEHDEESGSVGFCLNKPLDVMLNEVIDEFPEFEARVYCGGPVKKRALFFLHGYGDLIEDSKLISTGVWWGVNFEALKILATQGLVSPERIRFFVGYSGWSEGQLEEELSSGSWITAEMHPNYMFKDDPTELWQHSMKNKGNNFAIIAAIPDAMNLN
ncbi:MAG: YqgE/AlgH family protein [Saprospiraceae bacterium]